MKSPLVPIDGSPQAQRPAAEAGPDASAHVRIGDAAEETVGRAGAQGCDAIVMGTRGRGAVAGLVLGSVARRVVNLAAVPFTQLK
jgi:nucleotide-binding universal stress UspA family protein